MAVLASVVRELFGDAAASGERSALRAAASEASGPMDRTLVGLERRAIGPKELETKIAAAGSDPVAVSGVLREADKTEGLAGALKEAVDQLPPEAKPATSYRAARWQTPAPGDRAVAVAINKHAEELPEFWAGNRSAPLERVLSEVAAQVPEGSWQRTALDALNKRVGNARIFVSPTEEGSHFMGGTWGGRGGVSVQPSALNAPGGQVELLIHEAKHAVTANFFHANPTHKLTKRADTLLGYAVARARRQYGDDLVDEAMAINNANVDRANGRLAPKFKASPEAEVLAHDLYGLTNKDEFVSEVDANPHFMDWLVKSEEFAGADEVHTSGSLFDSLLKLLGELWGFDPKLAKSSARLSDELNRAGGAFNVGREARRGRVLGNRKLPSPEASLAMHKKSLEELRNTIGGGGGVTHFGTTGFKGKTVVSEDDVSNALAARLPDGVTADSIVKAFFGPKWEDISDLEVTLVNDHLRVDGQGPVMYTMRTFSPDMKTVSHDGIGLKPGYAGTGYFKNVMRSTMDLYEQMGVEKIKIEAGLDNGAYTWLRLGFTPDDPVEVADSALRRLKADLKGTPPNDPAWVDVANLDLFMHQHSKDRWLNQLLIEQGKQSEALKEALGEPNPMRSVYAKSPVWAGSLDLKDKEAMEVFNAYTGRGESNND